MSRRTIGVVALLVGVVALAAGLALFRLSRFVAGPEVAGTTPADAVSAGEPQAQARITARLFYGAEDGMRLEAVEREVPLADTAVEQARRILEAQLQPAPAPLVSAIPPGTSIRAFFLTGEGRAVVDLSGEARTRHPGGSTSELLTVYAIVNALTVNLPAITSVQILIDGRTAESLAGHVDLRRPLRRNLELVVESSDPAAPTAPRAAPGAVH